MDLLLFAVLFAFGYLVSPALAVYSWARWARSRRRRSRSVRVSLAGLSLASAALLFGIAAVAWSSRHQGAFLYLGPAHRWIYLCGIILSSTAGFAGLLGALQPNPIRVKSLVVALGAMCFWFLAGSGS